MKIQKRKGWIVTLLTIFLLATFIQPKAEAAEADHLNINADAAILADAKTGKILYAKNIDTVLGIASMTKMMTEYLLLEAVHEGKVSWDQEYSVSPYVYQISQNRGLSNVPLRKDGKYKIRELYEAMAIYSANGATIAIAETIAGSESNFVKMMNDKAEQLGMKDFKFVNSTGLNNEDLNGMQPEGTGPNDENVVSARGIAILAYEILKKFPEVLETASIPKKVFREGTEDAINMQNWNWMLPSLVYGYEGVDGLKTGNTDFAGYCFTGTAERNGMRFITVVMNAKTGNVKEHKARFEETRKLLDYGFTNFSMEELYPAGYQMKGKSQINVTKGKEDKVSFAADKPISMVVKRGEKKQYKPVYNLDKKELTAPVKKGATVGTMTVSYKGDNDHGFLKGKGGAEAKLITDSKVEKANWFVLSMRGIGGFFGDVWSSISKTVKGWF